MAGVEVEIEELWAVEFEEEDSAQSEDQVPKLKVVKWAGCGSESEEGWLRMKDDIHSMVRGFVDD